MEAVKQVRNYHIKGFCSLSDNLGNEKRNKLLPVLGMKKNNAYITKGTYGMLTYILGISYGMYSGLVIPVLHVDSVKQFQLFTLTYIISLYPGVI